MKLTAFLLSFCFLMISAQPVMAKLSGMVGACKMECGESKSCHREKGKDQKEEEKCPACCCNIYQCAFCTGTIVEESVFEISLFPKSAKLFPHADLILHSSYSSDCWQPPELV